MNLKLERPLVLFDLETTGLNIGKDKIIEICLLKVFPDGTQEERTLRINPECHIPEETSLVHHIYDEDVKDKPTFREVADEINAFMEDCDIAGFNSNHFDIPLLVEEFLRCGKTFDIRNRKLIDVQQIFHKMEPRNLIAAYKFYCGKDLNDAHCATADTKATFEVLDAQIARYANTIYTDRDGIESTPVTPNVKDLSAFTVNSRNVDFASHIVLNNKDEEVFNFGKHKNERVKDVFTKEPAYYSWMMNADFPLYTKQVITQIYKELQLERKFNS